MTHFNLKKYLSRAATLGLSLALVFALPSCGDDDDKNDDPSPSNGVSDNLHFNFKTPDWERNIDCTHLDLPAYGIDANTNYTSASSQSTKSTFFFSFPKDSSEMVKSENLKRYGIKEYGQNDQPFQLSFKVPLTETSSQRLVSQEGESATSFNEIVSVKYDGHDATEAFFKVKAKYQMMMAEVTDPSIRKEVTGTFHFRIRTTRK